MEKIAVLIPCYNESTTIKKVIQDYKRYSQRQRFTFMTIILLIIQMKLREKQEQLCGMNTGREKEM